MKETEREVLMSMRAQVRLLRRLNERAREMGLHGIKSLKMDGMPRGSGSCAGLDIRVIRQEEMANHIKRETARLRRIERKARQVMEGMKPGLYAFCAMYYIGGMTMEDTAEAIDRSKRQCERYKREIEGGEE